jgi:hypothetical protein
MVWDEDSNPARGGIMGHTAEHVAFMIIYVSRPFKQLVRANAAEFWSAATRRRFFKR